ncbi:hypothetical protein [Vibrio hepatarius]|uniref:hypothetical protein n=1 Tax=Vibrio hepatarius TaxID=171383 RepID=UPI001C083D0E|nr:hypothetical protein [Vibrio hepatarius]MBU2898835.1 hypothetical protein [Vibrio hepatarius]
MNAHFVKTIALTLLVLNITACSLFSLTDREPYYPLFRDSVYTDDSVTIIDTNNVVRKAIKSNDYVNVSDHEAVNNNASKIFSEAITSSATSIKDIQNTYFHNGLEAVIKQFTCEMYASQQPANSVQLCPLSSEILNNNLQHLPFTKGLRVNHRLSVTVHDDSGDLELEFFLKSTQERSLNTLWGAVHELGNILHSNLAEESLVLTINMSVHKKNHLDTLWRALHHEPLVFFVILPSVDSILQSKNEAESMDFAYAEAKLLVVDSR